MRMEHLPLRLCLHQLLFADSSLLHTRTAPECSLSHAQQEFDMESNFQKSIKRSFTKDHFPVCDKSKLCMAGSRALALKYCLFPGAYPNGKQNQPLLDYSSMV